MDARVVDNSGAKRFEFAIGSFLAVAYYRIEDGRGALLHTEAPQEFTGQGSGTKLDEGVLAQTRASGRRVTVQSPFMAQFVSRRGICRQATQLGEALCEGERRLVPGFFLLYPP